MWWPKKKVNKIKTKLINEKNSKNLQRRIDEAHCQRYLWINNDNLRNSFVIFVYRFLLDLFVSRDIGVLDLSSPSRVV